MRATWLLDGSTSTLTLALDAEDPVYGRGQGVRRVGMLARECRVELPNEIREPHPDLLALAALVICRPWVAHRLQMGRGVSRPFSEMVEKLFKIELGPIDAMLAPRTAGGVPLLAYSGGADSIAASELLPDGIPHVHLRRIPHPRVPNRATQVRPDVIEKLVLEAGQRGRQVHVVRTNLEYLVHPFPSLPHWFAIAVGNLILADELDGGAIALGGTFETFYMDMGRRWTGRATGGLGPAADLVGLPLLRPALGLTEIGTMAVTLKSNLADIARSCVMGTDKEPCHECVKCVRKELTTAALADGRETARLPAAPHRLVAGMERPER